MRAFLAVLVVGLIAACAALGPRMPQDVAPISDDTKGTVNEQF